MPGLRTDAWLLRGISGIPGQLRLSSSILSFTASGTGSAWPFQLRKLARQLQLPGDGEGLTRGETLQLFAWPVREVTWRAPWFYFGGGIKLQRPGVSLRVSFGQPVGPRQGPRRALASLRQVGAMRALGKQWATALAQCDEQPRNGT